jgi:haloalkane dehalogenase
MESSLPQSTPDRRKNDRWKKLYPYRGSRLRVGDWELHYVDSADEFPVAAEGPAANGPATNGQGTNGQGTNGQATNSPVILCVHGNPTWSFYWRRVIDQFAGKVRVVAVDHLGCGRSDKPSRREADYRLAAHRDRLVELIDRLDLRRIVLLAHDWGGAIGLGAAVERVERMSGVVLLNTGAFPPPYVPARIAACRLPAVGTLAVRGLNLFARAALTMAMSKRTLDPDAAAGLIAPYGNWHDRVAIDAFVRDIPLTRRHPTYRTLESLERDLSKLTAIPRMMVWGMKDWCFTPVCLERFLTHWPDAQVKRLADVGHYVMEDDPDSVIEAIEELMTGLRVAGTGPAR